jgi:exopolysaccharide production protein ExoZ
MSASDVEAIGKSARSPRAEFLDVARGLAILGVMAVHTSQQFKVDGFLDRLFFAGQFGVQLFFVVSAFTMCLTLEQRFCKDQRPFLAFWVRRFSRLAVPMWVAMFVYSLFFLAGNTNFVSKTLDPLVLLLTATLLNGLSPVAFNAVVPGGATIATEALFYLVFPLIYPLRHRVSALAILCVAIVVFDQVIFRPSVSWLVEFSGSVDESVLKNFFHYGLIKQLPVFLIGMIVFTLVQRPRTPSRLELVFVVLAGAAFSLGSTWLAGVAVVAGVIVWLLWRRSISSAFVSWLGRCSYSLYLFHFAIVNAVIAWLPRTQNAYIDLGLALFVVIAGSCVVASFTRPFLEDAGTAMGRRLVVRWRL